MPDLILADETRDIPFYEDTIMVVVSDNDVYVPLRPLVDALGLAWNGQFERVQRDPVLSELVRSVRVTRTEPDGLGGTRESVREMVSLHLDYVSGFLFGINANRVKSELREKVIRFQRECYRVLADHFRPATAVSSAPDNSLMAVYEMGMAIARMAKEQMALDQRLSATETAVDDIGQRISALEAQASSGSLVTEDEASRISQAVKAVAIALGKQTKRNEFGAVYGELYRKFGITSYKNLPRSKFGAAMAFLTEWHQALVGDSPF